MGKKRLTEEDKNEIRRLTAEGHTQAALAAMFDVSTMTIYRVTNPEYYAKTLERSREYQKKNAASIQKKYSESRRNYNISFSYETDAAVIAHLNKKDNVNAYVRTLITDDIEKESKPKN